MLFVAARGRWPLCTAVLPFGFDRLSRVPNFLTLVRGWWTYLSCVGRFLLAVSCLLAVYGVLVALQDSCFLLTCLVAFVRVCMPVLPPTSLPRWPLHPDPILLRLGFSALSLAFQCPSFGDQLVLFWFLSMALGPLDFSRRLFAHAFGCLGWHVSGIFEYLVP